MKRGRPTVDAARERDKRLMEALACWLGRRAPTQADLARLVRDHLKCSERTAYDHARRLLRQMAARIDEVREPTALKLARARAVRDELARREVIRAA